MNNTFFTFYTNILRDTAAKEYNLLQRIRRTTQKKTLMRRVPSTKICGQWRHLRGSGRGGGGGWTDGRLKQGRLEHVSPTVLYRVIQVSILTSRPATIRRYSCTTCLLRRVALRKRTFRLKPQVYSCSLCSLLGGGEIRKIDTFHAFFCTVQRVLISHTYKKKRK